LALLPAPRPVSRRWALLPLRLVAGAGFVSHGWAKLGRGPAGFARLLEQIGMPFPAVSAWLVTLVEVFGGLALLAGALVAVISIPLAVSMLVAMFTVHLRYGFSSINTIGLGPEGPVFGPPGYEINLLYIGALLALALAGPTAWSVDGWRRGRRLKEGGSSGWALACGATARRPW
jgi:putative oxidoreductase